MKKESFLSMLGLLVMVTPFLGIPSSWKTVTEVALGCLIMLTALSLRHMLNQMRRQSRGRGDAGDTYMETHTQHEDGHTQAYETHSTRRWYQRRPRSDS